MALSISPVAIVWRHRVGILKKHILVIDSDNGFSQALAAGLIAMNYDVTIAATSSEGLLSVYQGWPELVVMAMGLPDADGLHLCQTLREISNVPIVMMAAPEQEEDMVAGMKLGADLVLSKPLSIRVLVARIKALMRRAYADDSPNCEIERVLEYDTLTIELDTKQVTYKHQPIKLSPTEFRLLSTMVKNRGKALSRNYLLQEVWGPEYVGEVEHLRLYIGYLRRKFEVNPAHPELIQTIWGVGYRFGS
jgi:DNA-binding response OmpR family regulator